MPGRGYNARMRQKATRGTMPDACGSALARTLPQRFHYAIHGNKAAKRNIARKTGGSNRRRRADKRLPQGEKRGSAAKEKSGFFQPIIAVS